MIGDLDKTIKTLLEQELAHVSVTISFDTPAREFEPTSPTIDLFLYDVRENRELRSNEWHVERSNGAATRTRAAMRVDCSYLITTWAGDIESEHTLLGEVMQALLRHPTIPEAVLQGNLRQQEVPLPTTSLQAGRLQSLAEFWQALEGKPKAVLNYMVTIGIAAQAPVPAGPPVVEKVLRFQTGAEKGA